MKTTQRNYLNMAQAVNTFLDENSGLWSAIPVINTSKTNLSSYIDQINALENMQSEAQVFIGPAKQALKRTLSEKADILSDALAAYADIEGKTELLSKADTSYSDFFRLPDNELDTKVNELLSALTTHQTALADYGISEAQLTELQDSLNSYMAMVGKPRNYQIASRQATETLEETFSALRTQLDLLDKQMKIFKRNQPLFYRGYIASRTIVD